MAMIVTNDTFEKEVKQSELPVVVDAFASWCGPCKTLGPVFDAVASEMAATHKLVKLDVDASREIAVELGVVSVPTLIFFKDGKVVAKETGSMDESGLKAKIKAHLG